MPKNHIELSTMQMTKFDVEGYPKFALHHQQNCKQEEDDATNY